MAVVNIHRRELPCSEAELGALIDGLGGRAGGMWPDDDPWPAMRFDRPLGSGAAGGHGPIRYRVSHHTPGRWVRFEFTGEPVGFVGFHEFTAEPTATGAVLTHVVVLRPRGAARVTWPLLWRPLHNAVLTTTLDRAEHLITGHVERPSSLSIWTRILIRIAARTPRALLRAAAQTREDFALDHIASEVLTTTRAARRQTSSAHTAAVGPLTRNPSDRSD